MSKKKLILSQEQINKLCENESFNYFKDLGVKPDIGNIYSTEITTSGAMDDGYPEPVTTDDKSHTMTTNWRGQARLNGMGPISLREMSKKEWVETFLVSEENSRLLNKTFGSNGNRKSYGATKTAICRKKKAEEKLINGTEAEKEKAQRTINAMNNNWSDIDMAEKQYSTAKKTDKLIQNSKPGPKIKSAPKNSGNGKSHSPKNGVFLN